MKVKDLVLVSLFAAMMCIFSIMRIPLPTPVPFTLQIFGVAITGALLGGYLGAMALIIYTLLGAIGLPVFSGMTGGVQVLVGPTGGYIFGFVIAAFVIGFCMNSYVYKSSNPIARFISTFLVMTLGLIICYFIGTIQLKFVTGLPWPKAMAAGVLPFIMLDLLKMVFATVSVHFIYPSLVKANLVVPK
ncbi:MAG TPA: biotin transporter BioY [Epulopiscium sp.]|nr:biotin transporter BioY [Candidatus Epulonipiscium sp.]